MDACFYQYTIFRVQFQENFAFYNFYVFYFLCVCVLVFVFLLFGLFVFKFWVICCFMLDVYGVLFGQCVYF